MLASLLRRYRERVPPEAYHGGLLALAPVDASLSFLAKRSFRLYQLWDRYAVATNRLFAEPVGQGTGAQVDPNVLSVLRRDGIVTVPGAANADDVVRARELILDLYRESVARRQALDPGGTQENLRWALPGLVCHHCRRDGRTRFYIDESQDPASTRTEFARLLEKLSGGQACAEAYFGTRSVFGHRPYVMAEVLEPAPELENWHIDCLRPTMKSLVYLTDVGPENGPLRYIPGTHRVDAERHQLFYRIGHGGLGHAYFDQATNARLDARAQPVLARAGTAVLFDTRGLHASSICRKDVRVVVVNGFRPVAALRINPRNFRDPAPVPYPWEQM
jgi:hypothetical protein